MRSEQCASCPPDWKDDQQSHFSLQSEHPHVSKPPPLHGPFTTWEWVSQAAVSTTNTCTNPRDRLHRILPKQRSSDYSLFAWDIQRARPGTPGAFSSTILKTSDIYRWGIHEQKKKKMPVTCGEIQTRNLQHSRRTSNPDTPQERPAPPNL